MANRFCSQLGGDNNDGLARDGLTEDTAWSVADMSVSWTGLGFDAAGPYFTLYLMDAITSKFIIGHNGDYTIVRGDYPSRECTITNTADHCIETNQTGVEITRLKLEGSTAAYKGVLLTDAAISCKVYNNIVNKAIGIHLNGSESCEIYSNTIFMTPDVSGVGIRIYNNASNNIIKDNSIKSTYVALGAFQTGIKIDECTGTANIVKYNHVDIMVGSCMMIQNADSNIVLGNIFGPTCHTAMNLENADSNDVYNNYFGIDDVQGDPDQTALKLGNKFDDPPGGTGADYNTIRNNIIHVAGSIVKFPLTAGGGGTGTVQNMGDNNIFENNLYRHDNPPLGEDIIYVHDSTHNSNFTLAEFQAMGYEAGGIEVDPQLSADYFPAPQGPCIGNGTTLLSNYDFHSRPKVGSGNHIGAKWPKIGGSSVRRKL